MDCPDQLGDGLRQAIGGGRCTILEAMCTRELGDPFRRDALEPLHRRNL